MFHSARLKLTAWYLFIIMFISASFSIVIYKVLTNEVERFAQAQRFRIERRFREGITLPSNWNFQQAFPQIPMLDPELVDETKHRILIILTAINGSILILSGGLGYLLAGRTLRPIQDMVDEQNRFISDSSHELRTPLTSLKSAMEVSLRDKTLSLEDSKKLISESIEEVDKLQLLSDQLLQLTQYQKPNGNIQFEQVSLPEVVSKVVRKIEPLARSKNISIQSKVNAIVLSSDKYGLNDLLTILLDNAIKYSADNKVVTISSLKKNSLVIIKVKDHGIGIGKKDVPHIFDRFYRADAARSKTAAIGYGLGLSIAKKIVDIHHGEISVKSTIGKGSTFIIQLPMKQSNSKKRQLFS